ncbi:MAG: hypothetical protein V9E94_00825 [Microthrixaceae bacterium]
MRRNRRDFDADSFAATAANMRNTNNPSPLPRSKSPPATNRT